MYGHLLCVAMNDVVEYDIYLLAFYTSIVAKVFLSLIASKWDNPKKPAPVCYQEKNGLYVYWILLPIPPCRKKEFLCLWSSTKKELRIEKKKVKALQDSSFQLDFFETFSDSLMKPLGFLHLFRRGFENLGHVFKGFRRVTASFKDVLMSLWGSWTSLGVSKSFSQA